MKSTTLKAILSTIAFLLITYFAGWIYWYAWFFLYYTSEWLFGR